MRVTQYIFVFLSVLTVVSSNQQCPAPAPCHCNGDFIFCNNVNVTSVPTLTGDANKTYYLTLEGNPHLVITNSSFNNILLRSLNLDYSTNFTMDEHALKSQSHSLKELHISNAGLKSVPKAIGDLKELQILYLSHNNFQHFDLSLMEKLGISLKKIDLSSNSLTSWPNWLRHMWDLHWLDVSNNDFKVIPNGYFRSFNKRLTYLNMENTGITNIPTGIETLNQLKELRIGGTTLTDQSFFLDWLPLNKPNLQKLWISDTAITKIPIGLSVQTSLSHLYIAKSKIAHVEEEAMPTHLETFYLTESLITRVQSGVCRTTLTNLELDNNHIDSIERHDLDDCVNLEYVSFDDNNIKYISSGAFARLRRLKVLYMQSNGITRIPVALQNLASLTDLYLSRNPIECTCDSEWFESWHQNKTNMIITGQCLNLDIPLADMKYHCT